MRQAPSRNIKRPLPATRRIVTWFTALAMLSYGLTAAPIVLRMAAGHSGPSTEQTAGIPPPLYAGHGHHEHPSDKSSPGDHVHCVFCQGGIGPAFISAPVPWIAPSSESASFAIVRRSPLAIQHRSVGYASRAPPPLV